MQVLEDPHGWVTGTLIHLKLFVFWIGICFWLEQSPKPWEDDQAGRGGCTLTSRCLWGYDEIAGSRRGRGCGQWHITVSVGTPLGLDESFTRAWLCLCRTRLPVTLTNRTWVSLLTVFLGWSTVYSWNRFFFFYYSLAWFHRGKRCTSNTSVKTPSLFAFFHCPQQVLYLQQLAQITSEHLPKTNWNPINPKGVVVAISLETVPLCKARLTHLYCLSIKGLKEVKP